MGTTTTQLNNSEKGALVATALAANKVSQHCTAVAALVPVGPDMGAAKAAIATLAQSWELFAQELVEIATNGVTHND